MQSSLTGAEHFGDDNDMESYDDETEMTEDEYQQQLFRREDMTIADLPDSEREKVSRLVDKLVSLGREHEGLLADLAYERSKCTEEAMSYTRKLQKSSQDFELEKQLMREQMTELQSKHRSGLRLLHLYQVSLENFLRDNCALKDALLARTKNTNGDSDSADVNNTRELDSEKALEMKSAIERLEALSSSQQAMMEIVQSDNRTLTADHEGTKLELQAAVNNLKLSDDMLVDCRKHLEAALFSQPDNIQQQRDASTMEVACEGMARQLAEMFVRAEERDREIEMYKQSSRSGSLLHSKTHSSIDGGSYVAPDLQRESDQLDIDALRNSDPRSSQHSRGEGRMMTYNSREEHTSSRAHPQHGNMHICSNHDGNNNEMNGPPQAMNKEHRSRQPPRTDTNTDRETDRGRSFTVKNEEERGMDRTPLQSTSIERSSAISNENSRVDRRMNRVAHEEYEGRRDRVTALDNSLSSSTAMSVRFSQSLSQPHDLQGNRRGGGQYDDHANHRETSTPTSRSTWAERRQTPSSSSAVRTSQSMTPKTHSHDHPYSTSSTSYRKPLPVHIGSSTNGSVLTTKGMTNHAQSINATRGRAKEKRGRNQSVEETKSEKKERGLLSFDCARDGYDSQLFDLLDSIETNSQGRH